MNSSSANNFLLKSVQPSAAAGAAPKHHYHDDQAASFAENFKDVQENARAHQEKAAKPAPKKVVPAERPARDIDPKPVAQAKHGNKVQPDASDSKLASKKAETLDPESEQLDAGVNPAQTPPSASSEAINPISLAVHMPVDMPVEVGVETDTDLIPPVGETDSLEPADLESPLATKMAKPEVQATLLDSPNPLASQAPADLLETAEEQSPLILSMAGQGSSKPATTQSPLTQISQVKAPLTSATPASAALALSAATADEASEAETARILAGVLAAENPKANASAAAANTEIEADATQAQLLDPKGNFDKTSFEKTLQNLVKGESHGRDESSLQAAPNQAASAGTNTGALDSLLRFGEASTPAARSFVAQAAVPVPVGQPQWSQAVGEKVLWLAAQNISSAEINLNPEHLGPMQVKVSVHQDQTTVSFTSHHAVVREVLDQNLGRLRDMFSEQGLNLVNVDVSDKSFSRQQGEGQDQKGRSGNKDSVEEETPVAVSQITQQRLVDHYA